ncbi:MAG: leucine-rich repeat domain-containing protein [Kiritimatiellae bacterium]|nr:leucine-rich repeat domain-containing protein [Kiritimatiellia bacterium]
MANQVFKAWAGIGLALAVGSAVAAGDEIDMHFEGHYNGPWQWESLTMQHTTQSSGLHQTITYTGTVAITGYTGNETDLVIPETIAWQYDLTSSDNSLSTHYSCEVEVTEIRTFQTTATSVTVPNSVTNIGDWAFVSAHSPNLQSITMGEGVKHIGWYAFSECKNLTSIVIPDNVESIEEGAFCHCPGLESVTIGNGIETWGTQVFADCTSLSSVTLAEGLKGIGESAFSGCTSLASIDIPNSVKSIGNGAFLRCSSLESVSLGNDVADLGGFAFSDARGL